MKKTPALYNKKFPYLPTGEILLAEENLINRIDNYEPLVWADYGSIADCTGAFKNEEEYFMFVGARKVMQQLLDKIDDFDLRIGKIYAHDHLSKDEKTNVKKLIASRQCILNEIKRINDKMNKLCSDRFVSEYSPKDSWGKCDCSWLANRCKEHYHKEFERVINGKK